MKWIVSAGIGLLSLNSCIQQERNVNNKPNVLFIVVDDMNGYGVLDQYSFVKMPYLSKFKKESVNFINAACNAPVCNPSRASFLSGLYPYHTGAYINGADAWNKPQCVLDETESLPECFKRNGYTTWGRGKMFHSPLDSAREHAMWDNRPIYKGGFGPFPKDKSYWLGGTRFRSIEAWTGPDSDFPDIKNADAAIKFLKEKHGHPFFMFYGLWRPHSPYTAPKRFFDMYKDDKFFLPPGQKAGDLDDVPALGRLLVDSLFHYEYDKGKKDPEKLEKFIKAYAANSSFADWNVGRVIAALDSSSYAGNTIVIVCSDNGFHCGEKLRWGKATLWDQADYVPLLIRTPGIKPDICKRTVSLVDIYPTLVDYCNLSPPKHNLDGLSMVRLLKDPSSEWQRPSFTCYGIQYSSVRNERYRYIRYPDGSQELYDHRDDPYEFNNVINKPEYNSIIRELSERIPKEWKPSVGGRLEVPR